MAHGSPQRMANFFPSGQSVKPGMFGRMFPYLKPLVSSDADLKKLGGQMVESAAAPSSDVADVPAGYTYLGQFVDHDMTLDTTSLSEVAEDPLATENFRTPRFDLDSVYAQGPEGDPAMYQRADKNKFLIGNTRTQTNELGADIGIKPNDLPRNSEGFAIIGDPRNDENTIVAQLHLAFLKFHNKVVDTLKAQGVPADKLFTEARRTVTWHYQWIVLKDFLPRLVDSQSTIDSVLEAGRKFYDFEKYTYMPVEFSVAAYRLGHTMVRENYDFNRNFNNIAGSSKAQATLGLLFNFTGLSGPNTGPFVMPLPSDWIVDWQRFFELPPSASTAPNKPTLNKIRAFDPYTVPALHNLPGIPDPDLKKLPVRNLLRGARVGLPSGQAVAAMMGIPPLLPADFAGAPELAGLAAAKFDEATPLWYYILKEAEKKSGSQRLGPVGSRILAEVFVGLLEGDPHSFLSQAPEWKPTLGTTAGKFTMADMIIFVNDVNPNGEP